MTPPDALRARLLALQAQHGGVRLAARALKMDAAYFVRLRDGDKTNPSDATLRKLKLKRVISYVHA